MMKLTKRGKIVFGSLFTAIFVASGIVVLPPALSPTQAEAQIKQKQYQKQYQERALAKYENADRLTKTELVDLLHAVGFKGEALRHAWAIVMKESRGNPLSHNGNRDTGDNSFGLFQINMVDSLGQDRRDKFSLEYNAQLLNPVVNAKIAYHMSKQGENWVAWKGVNNSVVKGWLAQFPEAQAKALAKAKARAIGQATE
jgi:hypothetical protein